MGVIVMGRFKKLMLGIGSALMLVGCVKDRNFDRPEESCVSDLTANATYAEVKTLYVGETVQVQQNLVIEGYVVSSDAAGNFFNVLHFQDKPIAPSAGFQFEIDLRDSHLFFPPGSKIYIKLKGMYIGKAKDVYKIGGAFTSFGNVSVGRLPAAVLHRHVFVSCDENAVLQPTKVSIDNLNSELTNTLVQLENVEILSEELGRPFAVRQEETERTLVDCQDNETGLLNSGFADFQSTLLPEGNGTLTGVLLRENNNYFLAIRDLDDIDFSAERCADIVDEFTSETIFISELADPDNNTGARFVELYNSSATSLPLNGWSLRRYTNDNTEVGSTVDLSGFTIAGETALVLSPNPREFEAVYGFPPDLGTGTNSPADSNGDDNLELVDPFGNVIDVFGVIGEDGSGTDHEFEDGRAVRNIGVTLGNPIYDFSEWILYNDSGGNGTVNAPQNAPEDFTPGTRD